MRKHFIFNRNNNLMEKEIDPKLLSRIEEIIDGLSENPEKHISDISNILSNQGIEPGLEQILSYGAGLVLGVTVSHLRVEDVTEVEFEKQFKMVLALLGSRAWELRKAVSIAQFK